MSDLNHLLQLMHALDALEIPRHELAVVQVEHGEVPILDAREVAGDLGMGVGEQT